MTSFNDLVGMTDDQVKQRDLALARRVLQRKFASAYDDAERQLISENSKQAGMFDAIRRSPTQGVERFDINEYTSAATRIAHLQVLRETIATQYQELFGEEIPVL